MCGLEDSVSPAELSSGQRSFSAPSAVLHIRGVNLLAFQSGSGRPRSLPPVACSAAPVIEPVRTRKHPLWFQVRLNDNMTPVHVLTELRLICSHFSAKMMEEVKCGQFEGCFTLLMYTASLSLRTIISCLSLVRVLRNSWFSAAATSRSIAGSPLGPTQTMAPALTLKINPSAKDIKLKKGEMAHHEKICLRS